MSGDILDRVFSALNRGPRKFEPDAVPIDTNPFTFVAAHDDLGKRFQQLNLKNIKLPTNIPVLITVSIAGDGASLLRSDKYVCDCIKEIAVGSIDDLFNKLAKVLQDADGDLSDDKKKQLVAPHIEKTILAQFEYLEQSTAQDIVKRVEAYPAYIKFATKSVKQFKVKCGASIALSGVVIVGGAVITGLTWGATGPAAVVAIARSGVQMAHTIGDLAANIDQIGWMVKAQLRVLERMFEEALADDSEKKSSTKKIKNSLKNAAMEIGSGLLGAKSIPTVKNCEGYLDTYKVKMLELDIKLAKLGPQIIPLEQGINDLQQQVDTLDDGPVRTIADQFLVCAKNQEQALKKKVQEVGAASRKGASNHQTWSRAIEEIQIHGWTKHVGTVVGAVTDLGLGVTGAGPDALLAGLAALISIEATVADQGIGAV